VTRLETQRDEKQQHHRWLRRAARPVSKPSKTRSGSDHEEWFRDARFARSSTTGGRFARSSTTD
jgi:hypothetical protein